MNFKTRIFKWVLFLLFIWQGKSLHSQDHYLDSCMQALKTAKEDTNKVILLNIVGWNISYSDLNKGLDYGLQSYDLAKKLKYRQKLSLICNTLAAIYNDMGQYEKTLSYANEGIEYAVEYRQYFEKGDLLNSISSMYQKRNEMPKAISYLRKAMQSYAVIKDEEAIVAMYNNLGGMYHEVKLFDSALFYLDKALDFNLKRNRKSKLMYNYVNLSEIYYEMGDISKSFMYAQKVVDISKEVDNKYVLSYALISYAKALNGLGKTKEALDALTEAESLAKASGELEVLKDSYKTFSDVFEEKNDYKTSLTYYKKYMLFKDSMLNDENIKQLRNAEAKYENEKKQKEIELLSEKQKLNETESEQKKLFLYAAFIGIIILAIVLMVLYRNTRLKQKTNSKLELFNKEVQLQKELVEVKNKEITDSINYAKRIQQSILTSDAYFEKNTSDYFILFKPKDIVSGDFYWALNHHDKFMVMTADCTGHGVPGAMMSMMGINFLNEIVNEKKTDSPADVLNQLRTDIIKALNPEGSLTETKDGMDCCLCSFDLKNKSLTYANANNPFYLIRDKALIVSNVNKMPIGAGHNQTEGFKEWVTGLQKDDLVILFTDGYADQFGGPKGKKFKYKQLEQLLLENAHRPLHEIRLKLDGAIEEWRGNLEQVDDICIIGIKI